MSSPIDDVLARIRSVDWTNQPEATISSQLIMPLLFILGYGEHTLHHVREQHTYTLRDPTMSKGSRRVRIDYEPTIYAEGLWVLEAKGTKERVSESTLGQVRDYAVHPEVRAALMVTVDAGGLRIFDPWDEHWEEPVAAFALNEIADRFPDLRAVLATDCVAGVIRRRHLDHLRRALSTSVEFGVLDEADREFRGLLEDARQSISERRRGIHEKVKKEDEERHKRVLQVSGVWGVVQHNNDPWIGSLGEIDDFAEAVLQRPVEDRPTEIDQIWPAIEAVYRTDTRTPSEQRRPLFWVHTVLLGGALALREKPGCEPAASNLAKQEIRNHLLGFPDDELASAFWRLQRTLIPLMCRVVALSPFDKIAAEIAAVQPPENRIRYPIDPPRLFVFGVRGAVIRYVRAIDPWTPGHLQQLAIELEETLDDATLPNREWIGPMGDPWLQSWRRVDPMLMCGLAVLQSFSSGDDLLASDPIRKKILEAAKGDEELLRRPAEPLALRLNLI